MLTRITSAAALAALILMIGGRKGAADEAYPAWENRGARH